MDDSVTLHSSFSRRAWMRAARARHGRLSSWSRPALFGVFVATGLTPLLLGATSDCGCGSRRNWVIVGVWVFMVLAYTAIFRLASSSQIRRMLKANPNLLSPMELKLAGDGYYESQPMLHTFRPWAAFTGWSERDDVAFLHLGAGAYGAFLMLPRAQVTPEQWQRTREILLAQIGPPTS